MVVDGKLLWRCESVNNGGCPNVARWICHWPGSDSKKCHGCKAKGEAIATALGFTLQSEPLPEPPPDPDADPAVVRFSLLELE